MSAKDREVQVRAAAAGKDIMVDRQTEQEKERICPRLLWCITSLSFPGKNGRGGWWMAPAHRRRTEQSKPPEGPKRENDYFLAKWFWLEFHLNLVWDGTSNQYSHTEATLWLNSFIQTLSRPEFLDLGTLSHPGPSCYTMNYIHGRLNDTHNDTRLMKVSNSACFHVRRVQLFSQFQNRSRPGDAYFYIFQMFQGGSSFGEMWTLSHAMKSTIEWMIRSATLPETISKVQSVAWKLRIISHSPFECRGLNGPSTLITKTFIPFTSTVMSIHAVHTPHCWNNLSIKRLVVYQKTDLQSGLF